MYYNKMQNSASPTPSRSSSIASSSFRSGISPLPPPVTTVGCMSAAAKRYKYLRRLFQYKQMDFEFALWQMIYLFIAPQKVYRNFYYRKQTKSQFARDDPAFLVLLIVWLVGSSVVLSLVLGFSFERYVLFTIYVVFVDCIGVGICIATVLWYLCNRFLKKNRLLSENVEWGYAFDVHLNAFFPPLVILHVFQMIFYNVVLRRAHFFGRLFGNTLWLIAAGYYNYITFLGYSSLPNLHKTHVLLYPLPLMFFGFILSMAIGMNITDCIVAFYTYR